MSLGEVGVGPFREIPMKAHIFRFDQVNHLVLTKKGHVRRNGKHHTLCALRVDQSFQRVSPQSLASCDVCIAGLVGFTDVVDYDFGFATWDDRTGRFA